MPLTAECFKYHLVNNHNFELDLIKNEKPNDKVYQLKHSALEHFLCINRELKNPKILAVPLKYHELEESLKSIKGITQGNISHHADYKNYWNHIGTTPYVSNGQKEPPARHYGIDDIHALDAFIRNILDHAHIPSTDPSLASLSPTEKDATIKARIGQGAYRKALIDYWNGCAVTGCTETSLLVSSHIKPWSVDEKARLNPFNGLLLSPNLDKAFDKGYISFNDDRTILISSKLSNQDCTLLGLSQSLELRKIHEKHKDYLAWHRNHKFEA